MYLSLQNKKQLRTLSQQIKSQNLQPLDAIVVKEIAFPFIDHYALFGGFDEHGFPVIVANYKTEDFPKGGVRILPHQDTIRFLKSMTFKRARRFKGDDYEFQNALKRAKKVFEVKPYSLIFNNCEHYINYVHYGNAYSQQTQIASGAVATAGVVTLLVSSNPWVALLGTVAFGLGAAVLGTELSKQNSFGKEEDQYARTNKHYA